MNSCFSDPSHTGPNVFADHPFPLLQTPISTLPPNTKTTCFHRMASEMVNIHNVIIRGLNSIYLQARSIPPADHGSFAHYMHQWHRLLDAHHAGEEHTFFPAVERLAGEAGIMGANVDQHRAFHDGMERFGAYALACVRGEVVFSGEEVVRIVDSFGGPLTEHLSAEIQSLLDLERFGEEKMAGMEKSAAEEAETAMKQLGLFTGLPFVLINHDSYYENGIWLNKFPPPEAKNALFVVRNVSHWLHSDWWKFGACDRQGRLRSLHAVPVKDGKAEHDHE